jgi:hypothetical protein
LVAARFRWISLLAFADFFLAIVLIPFFERRSRLGIRSFKSFYSNN